MLTFSLAGNSFSLTKSERHRTRLGLPLRPRQRSRPRWGCRSATAASRARRAPGRNRYRGLRPSGVGTCAASSLEWAEGAPLGHSLPRTGPVSGCHVRSAACLCCVERTSETTSGSRSRELWISDPAPIPAPAEPRSPSGGGFGPECYTRHDLPPGAFSSPSGICRVGVGFPQCPLSAGVFTTCCICCWSNAGTVE